MTRQREAGREHERRRERGPEERARLEQPREEDERGDEREPERHCDERGAEARSASDLAGTTIRRGSAASCVVPESTSPVALSRTIEFGNAFTPWSNRIHTDWGARSSRCRYEG